MCAVWNYKIFCSVFPTFRLNADPYVGLCQTSLIELFRKNNQQLLAIIYFCKNFPSYMVDRLLNIHLGYINARLLPLNLHILFIHWKSGRLQIFLQIGVLKNVAIFTGKQLCWSLLLIKLKNVIKKTSSTCVSCVYCGNI